MDVTSYLYQATPESIAQNGCNMLTVLGLLGASYLTLRYVWHRAKSKDSQSPEKRLIGDSIEDLIEIRDKVRADFDDFIDKHD